MKNRKSTIRSILAIGMLILAAIAGIQHPAFAVRNLKIGDPIDGLFSPRLDSRGMYDPEKLAGRPVAVVFWRPNHEFSTDVIRDIENLAKDIGAERFTTLLVDTKRSTAAEIDEAAKSEEISFPILRDPERILYKKVGVLVSPTTLLFDGEGKLRFIIPGHPRLFQQILQARLRFLLGEIDEETMAEKIKPTIIEMEQNWASAWRTYNLGKRLQMDGARDQAVTIYNKAIAQYPGIAEAHCALGFMELEIGNLKDASRHFEDTLVIQSDSSAALLGRAIILTSTGKADEAEKILLSLLGEQERSVFVRVRYELGRIYSGRGMFEKASGYYQAALAKVFSGTDHDSATSGGIQPKSGPNDLGPQGPSDIP